MDAPEAVRSAALDLLRCLASHGPLDATALAARAGVAPARARREIVRLLEGGYARRDARGMLAFAHFDFLDAPRIAAQIRARSPRAGIGVRVLDACGSTNTALLDDVQAALPALLVTEEQTAGRGRRGQRWVSDLGSSLTQSLCARIDVPAGTLPGLSLVSGIAVVRALESSGVRRVGLKWPNDIVTRDGGKLGGILVESRIGSDGTKVVIGTGINVRASRRVASLRRPATALDALIESPPARCALSAGIAVELLAALELFAAHGFEAFRSTWDAMHVHRGYRMRMRLANGCTLSGVAEGVGPDGALQLHNRYGAHLVRHGHIVSATAP